MKTKVVITVDTEPSVAGALEQHSHHKPLIHEPVAGIVNGQSEALGFLIRTLLKHELVATFFVETVHVSYFTNSPMEQYTVDLMEAGQDVQLHLHPVWRAFDENGPKNTSVVTDNCSELCTDELVALIQEGSDLLKRWTGKPITGMRPGNYSTGHSVFEALAKAGLQYSSCINLATAPPVERELQIVYGKHSIAGVFEIPVTCFRETGPIGRGRLKPMQVTSLSSSEMISMLDKAHSAQLESVVIVTHPFEFLKRDNAQYENVRSNRLVQKRFEKLCWYLQKNSDRFDVVPLDVAANKSAPASKSMADLKGNALLSVSRAVSNFTNDRLF